MNADKMYIPSMEKWSKYYQNVVQGNNKTYINHMKNTGRNGSFMIPIQNQRLSSTLSKSNEKCNLRLVSPSAQMVEMAKESLEDEGLQIKGKNVNERPVLRQAAVELISAKRKENRNETFFPIKNGFTNITEQLHRSYSFTIRSFRDTSIPVDCYLQGSLISSSNTNYSYKCMMKTLLDYGQDAKASQLTSALFYKDRSGHMDFFDTNTGLYERKKLIGNSKSLDMEGMLFHDLFEMDRYLLNMVDVKLKLFRSKPSFCLVSREDDADYDVVIEDIVVKVCKIKVNPAIIFAHSEALKSTNAKYPYTKTVMKHITLMIGSTNAVLENIFQDVKPKRIIMGLTSTNAVNGDYQLNPWNFQHFDLQQITLYCDGVPVDGIPLKLQFNEDRGATNVAAYVKMFENCGKWGGDAGNEITRSDFNNGYALFCFDLQPHFSDANYLSLVKQGKVRLECHFATPLPETVSLLILAENSGYFEITENRQIKVEH
ncbi:unnamed protein product [Mytilus coruscus]|uniref:Uncharacterized protein n=1 Tax=Mytilus coruscus TaxID=42192 RepID=A0A6J8BVU6_MYTCO|nr:unnamed protein product [Mytilus coruscus]